MKTSDNFDESKLYELNAKIPLSKAFPFGLQHILAMFVANIAPIMIVAGVIGLDSQTMAMLVQSAMLIAGIGTIIQLYPVWKIGSGLPIVMGISFTFVSIYCIIGAQYGYGVVLGAVLVGGLIEGCLGLLAKYWTKIISPIVSACVVTAIGFSLLSVGADSFGGGSSNADFGSSANILVGTITLVSCILFNIFAKKFYKQLSILFGLIVGYIVALCMGIVDFSGLENASIIAIPDILAVKPEFNLHAIISVTLIYLVSATETIGDTEALATVAFKRKATAKEIEGSIACDGFISALSSLFGNISITSFSQNIGLVALTGVINKFAIFTGACIMILAGFFPIIGQLIATLPSCVLGGCTIMMFGSIVVTGFKMIAGTGFSERNVTITALSLSIGIGFTQVPEIFNSLPDIFINVFAENCVAVVFLVAVILNLLLPKEQTKN